MPKRLIYVNIYDQQAVHVGVNYDNDFGGKSDANITLDADADADILDDIGALLDKVAERKGLDRLPVFGTDVAEVPANDVDVAETPASATRQRTR